MTIPDKCIFIRAPSFIETSNRNLRIKINDRMIYNYETKTKENIENLFMLSIGSNFKKVRVK